MASPVIVRKPAREAASVRYPPNHQAGMAVPKGGSMCANCRYLGEDKKICTSGYFIRWNGSNVIPGPADEYCSDFYEPRK